MGGKHSRRFAAVVLAGVLSLALGSPGATAAGGGASPAQADVNAAVAFRAKLGLPAGRSFVAATFGNRGYAKGRWGVPLDAAEAAEVGRRADVQKRIAGAVAAWSRDASSAGVYIDQHDRGTPVFLTTGDPGAAQRRLGARLPKGLPGAQPRFENVRHSMADLLAVQARVDADVASGALAGLSVESTAIDVRSNAVVVGLREVSEAARADLLARYGDAILVVEEAPSQGGDAGDCTSRKDCPPAKGGIEIRSDYNGANCTIGFLVRVVGSPEPRLLTAGHCIGRTGGTSTARTWTHDGVKVGWSELTTWVNGADADAGIITPTGGAVEGDRNLVFRASPADVVPISGWQPTAEQVQGGLVCRAGVTSGYHCGTIALTNRTKGVDGKTIDHQWVVDFDGCPGDSGGPYLLDDIAYGIHTDSTYGCDPATNQAWYSPIGWVLDVLAKHGHPVELCTKGECGRETNVWTERGSLAAAAWSPRLVPLDDGRVLQVGGYPSDPFGSLAGDGNGISPRLFDPGTGSWSDTAAPPWEPTECAGQFAVRLADGRVLVGGGRQLSGPPDGCDGAFLFDPAGGDDGSWSETEPPPSAVESAGAVLLGDGRAFVTGGTGTDGATSVAFTYDVATDHWASVAPAPGGALGQLALALPGGRVLVSGGRVIADSEAGGYADSTATYLYDPAADAWATTKAVGAAGMAGLVLQNGKVMIAGGRHLAWNGAQTAAYVAAAWLFDPAAGTWTSVAPMHAARAEFALVQVGSGELVAAGGAVAGGSDPWGTGSSSAEVYDWGTRAWHPAPTMTQARTAPGSTGLADGSILVAGGGVASTETYVLGDVLPPSATGPTIVLRSGVRMSSTAVPIHLSWSASDLGSAGVGTYDIAQSTDGGPFQTIATRVTTTSWDGTVRAWHNYRFQVRPRDWAGNLGAWRAGSTSRVSVTQESSSAVKYAGTWKRATVGGFDGGSMRYAKAAGASASFTFKGREIVYVASRGPNRGSARIYIDGSLAATISLYASTLTYRNEVFKRSWSYQGSHRIKIVVLGTRGHPLVDVDAFVVRSTP